MYTFFLITKEKKIGKMRILPLKGMRGDGGLKEQKEKLIKTKFISFGFVVVEQFLIKKNPLLKLYGNKKFAVSAISRFCLFFKSKICSSFFVLYVLLSLHSLFYLTFYLLSPFHVSKDFIQTDTHSIPLFQRTQVEMI